MDKKFLIEYEHHETEQFEKYSSIIDRFPDLPGPVFNLSCPCNSIWSQIAFSGSVIFPLNPMEAATFEKIYHISIKEIPDLVKFVKETNKVQFVLSEPPQSYAGLDYLDPIFEDIAPPLYALNKDYQNTAMHKSFDQAEDELSYLLEIVLSNFKDPAMKSHFREDYIRQYGYLQHFGFTDLSDIFFTTLIFDPDLATNYLELIYSIIVHPIIDPFKANPTVPLEMMQQINSLNLSPLIKSPTIGIPEVGDFLFKKTIQYSDSLNACKSVISTYKKNDLYSVYSALNEAVIEQNSSVIIDTETELEEIMDNIWKDTTIDQNKATYKYGMDVVCGLVGFSIGSFGGLIGSIGGAMASAAAASSTLDNYAELIAKKIASPHMATIYDFQKKHPNTK